MKKPIFFLLLTVFGLISTTGQVQNLEDYQYVIVPVKYDFLNEKDQYQLNSMTEFLFEKYGFTAISSEDKFPDELVNNRCAALNAEVISQSEGLFSFVTKLVVRLKNCNNQVIFESKEGKSRLKKYKFAYQEALRDAFSSFENSEAHELDISASSEEKVPGKTIEKQTLKNTTIRRFTNQGVEYELKKQEKAWVLKKTDEASPFAFLNETSTGNFIYRSENRNGSAYFDAGGNLIVEYFDTAKGEMQKQVFELQ